MKHGVKQQAGEGGSGEAVEEYTDAGVSVVWEEASVHEE